MKKIIKKAAIFTILAALILALLPVTASASSIEWDGRAPLERGTAYIISSEIFLRSDMIIPEGVTITVVDGGNLILIGDMRLTLRGTLVVRAGGMLEIRNAELDLRDGGSLFVFGSVLHYMETTINVIEGNLNIRAGAEFISSANIYVYEDGALHVAGSLMLTGSSVAIVTGVTDIAGDGVISVQGSFNITSNGTFNNSGQFLIRSSGKVINAGVFTLSRGAEFIRSGSFRNTASGIFYDRNKVDEFGRAVIPEKMTAALLADEPRVQVLGIDVSHWQFTIDWARVGRTNIEFAMIRAARGHHSADFPMIEDTRFRENIEGALANNIDVGVYFYSYAKSVEEARIEAEFFVNVIKDYELTYPVVFDIEEPFHQRMSKELISDITDAFFEIIIENGYYPMLYSNKFFLENVFDSRIPETYAVWLAQWTLYPTYAGEFFIWQYTDKGRVPGINGDVDLNVSYIDFPEVLRRHGLNRLG